ncbi:hypothetical protein JK162_10345 [Leuconostoc pseudomesenteroides]|jgi:hypothetical protein|uniref:hypothetical protein n=1 Tax=Leuconostoc pseudomesenteroides TaxID=33968 RepID=UPI001B8C6DB7|nr:hypothetical protein [Leuconostoc pseudomesenteroides]MBS0958862.1 hypothetical protein [Leuconostoc pseudomesenteroides]MCT4380592.1 hypothetical protein [Leuconostoc pseudomesenteroides]WAM39543.1 hypothetical protein OYT93_05020 [Leuconostoc pseudomesenteroides]
MADDIMAIERTRLSLVNGSRNMALMLDKLRAIDANEMANIRNIVKNIDVESGAIKTEKALRLIEEIRDVDVFNFTQDIVDVMKNIESSQEQLDVYIKAFRKLV